MDNSKKPNYEIRHLTTDDLEMYNALLRYAFQVTEQELTETGWRDDEIKQSKFPVLERADVLGCFDGENLVSQIAVYPLDMNIYGTTRSIGFVTSVCTYPEYTGHGIMKRLMRRSLEDMREKKQSFAMLFPYSIPLYRRFGYEIISNKISYAVAGGKMPAKAQAPGFGRPGRGGRRLGEPRLYGAARQVCVDHARLPLSECACLGGILALGRGRHRCRRLLQCDG